MEDTINVTDVNTFHTCVHCAASHTLIQSPYNAESHPDYGELLGAQVPGRGKYCPHFFLPFLRQWEE